MEEIQEELVPTGPTSSSKIKCLICASREVVKTDKTTVKEQLVLFEQLIEQKTDDKIQIEKIGFCRTCSDSLDSYKKLKNTCMKAWKALREKSNLVPVIVTPELKLFRIDDAGPGLRITKQTHNITKIQTVQRVQPKIIKQQQDPLSKVNSITMKASVKYSPYSAKNKSPIVSPSQSLIQKNYCYICNRVQSNLQKHLVMAHALIGKNSQITCNDCGLVCSNAKSFLQHFQHHHQPSQETTVSQRSILPSNIIKLEKIISSIPPKTQNITKVKEQHGT